jgi:hypothetical protein
MVIKAVASHTTDATSRGGLGWYGWSRCVWAGHAACGLVTRRVGDWGACVQDADEGEVKKAYKRAALKYHPDKWANATDVGRPHPPFTRPLVMSALHVLHPPKPQARESYPVKRDVAPFRIGLTCRVIRL